MAQSPPDPVFTLKGDQGPVNSLLFRSVGCEERLFAGTQEGKLHVWNLHSSRIESVINVHCDSCLSVLSVGRKFVTQGKNDCVKVWSAREHDLVEDFRIASDYHGFCRCDVYEDAAVIGIPSDSESKVDIFDSSSGKSILSLKPPNDVVKLGMLMAIKFIHLGGNLFVLSAYESGDIYLWDVKKNEITSHLKLSDTPMCIDFDSSSCQGVCGTSSNDVSVFLINESRCLLKKCEITITNAGVSCVKIRHDSRIFATGGWDGRIRVFSWKKLKPLAVLTFHKETVQDLGFSDEPVTAWNSSCLLAAGSKDQKISLWDIYNK